jgi:hypothetical protein
MSEPVGKFLAAKYAKYAKGGFVFVRVFRVVRFLKNIIRWGWMEIGNEPVAGSAIGAKYL